MMKRLTAYILIMALILTLAACGSAVPAPSGSTDQPQLSLPPVRPLDELGTEAQDIPVRIQTFEADADGDGVIAEVLVLYLSLPNAGEYSIDAYVGNTHVHTEPFDISTPLSVLSDSSGGVIGECVLGNRDSWGVEVWASVAGHAWDLEAIPTITLECESDTGSTISGEYSVEAILVEGGRWYRNLENSVASGYEAPTGSVTGDYLYIVPSDIRMYNGWKERYGSHGVRTESGILGNELEIVIAGDTTQQPDFIQKFTLDNFKMIINGAVHEYPIRNIRFLYNFPQYDAANSLTAYTLSLRDDNGDPVYFDEVPATYQFEMMFNNVFVQSDVYEVHPDGLITITDSPVPPLNILDLSYLEDINGNSTGNINNRGLAQESDNWIYYVNSGDNNYLYKIGVDGSGKTKLNSEACDEINVVGDWVVYRATDSGNICKVKTDGSERTLVCDDVVHGSIVFNNWIYYVSEESLCRIRLDGTEKAEIDTGAVIGSINVINQSVVFQGRGPVGPVLGTVAVDGGHLPVWDFESLHGGETIYIGFEVYEGVGYGSLATEGYAIYRDAYNPNTGEDIFGPVNDDASAFVTVADGWIYYQNLDDGGSLYKIRIDGTERTKLNSDSSESINAAGDWIYYENMSDNGRIYRMRTDGTERQPVE